MLVIMMFVGPQVVAEDKPRRAGGESAGAAPYADQAAADDGGGAATGRGRLRRQLRLLPHALRGRHQRAAVGPKLDDTSLDAGAIEGIVSDGTGSMPAFGGALSDDEIAAVAEFVAGAN